MLLSRVKLQECRGQLTLSVGGAVTFAAVLALSRWLIGVTTAVDTESAILFTADPVPPMPLYMLAGGSVACITLEVRLLLEPMLRSTKLLDYFTASGRQSLSLYLAHNYLGIGMSALMELC